MSDKSRVGLSENLADKCVTKNNLESLKKRLDSQRGVQ